MNENIILIINKIRIISLLINHNNFINRAFYSVKTIYCIVSLLNKLYSVSSFILFYFKHGRCWRLKDVPCTSSWNSRKCCFYEGHKEIKLLFLCQYDCQVKISGRLLIIVQKVSWLREVTWGLPALMGSVYCQDLPSVDLLLLLCNSRRILYGNIGRSHSVSRCLLTLW